MTVGAAGSVLTGAPAHAGAVDAERIHRRVLQRQVRDAAAEYGVPADLLLAMAWVNTHGRMPAPEETRYEPGSPHGRGVYGPAALVRNPYSDTVAEAARLTGISARQLMTERGANLRGGAALMALQRRHAPSTLSALDAVADDNSAYAGQLDQALATHPWERQQSSPDDGATLATQAATSKPAVTWYPAHENNYTSANRPSSNPIRTIVIHVTQGSWSGALSWFQNPNARVSAHYTVRSSDGRIGQSLSDINIGYHAGNWTVNQTSIGIEHEGYVDDSSWFTPVMYDRSARLTAYLCRRYGIPIDRQHIIGHNQVSGSDHTDPGRHWRWRHYMRKVRSYA